MATVPRIISTRRQPTTKAKPLKTIGVLNRRPPANLLKAPAAPSAPTYTPTASSAASVGSPAPTPPAAADPKDAQYFNDVAKLDQYYASNKANLSASGQELAANLAKNRSLLDEQQPKDQLAAKQNANKAGLFYSGALGKNLGDIATSYARRKSDLQTDFESNQGKINRQLSDLEANYGSQGLIRNDVMLQSIARARAQDEANAAAYAQQVAAQQQAAPAGGGAAPAAAAPAPASGPPKFTGVLAGNYVAPQMWDPRGFYSIGNYGKPGQTLHIYPDGRKVLVK